MIRMSSARLCRQPDRNQTTDIRIICQKVLAMFVHSIPVDVIGDAYHIAANYLKKAGRIPCELDIHQPLLDSIVEDFVRAKRIN
jgi:hypothetical protein